MPNCAKNRIEACVGTLDYAVYTLREVCECEYFRQDQSGAKYCFVPRGEKK